MWKELLETLIKCSVPIILGFVGKYIIKFSNAKTEELKNKTKNENFKNILEIADKIISECILATNQTYVEELKNRDLFDADAQKEAFMITLNNIKLILSEDIKEALNEHFGSADAYIQGKIESTIKENKEN